MLTCGEYIRKTGAAVRAGEGVVEGSIECNKGEVRTSGIHATESNDAARHDMHDR